MSYPSRRLSGLALLVALGPSSGPLLAAQTFEPMTVVAELAALGPRVPGSAAHAAAIEALSERMTSVGLHEVVSLRLPADEPWRTLSGRLPGAQGAEIVLSAHYDTVASSPGALDDASGCAVALAAAEELARTPRQNPLRVMLTDGEESLAAGSGAWLSSLAADERRRRLAHLDLEMVGAAGADRGLVHLLAAATTEGRRITPAWLVHAALEGAAAVGLPVTVLDRNWSWFAQLAVRCARPRRISDGHRFLASGVPSVLLSDAPLTDPGRHYHRASDRPEVVDPARLRTWSTAVAAIVRRLDRLADRPIDDGEYLVVGGRLWVRRNLVWIGFALWILLVWRGLPGRWRGASTAERRSLGRGYLPGFAFRMLFLLAVFLMPTFATVLLYPTAAAALVGAGRSLRSRRLLCAFGALPTLAFAGWLAFGQFAGWFVLERAALLPATLVALTVATFCSWLLDPAHGGLAVRRTET